MWQDPIVSETRALREEYARKFNHDVGAIFLDIQKRQEASGKKFVSFQPRKAMIIPPSNHQPAQNSNRTCK